MTFYNIALNIVTNLKANSHRFDKNCCLNYFQIFKKIKYFIKNNYFHRDNRRFLHSHQRRYIVFFKYDYVDDLEQNSPHWWKTALINCRLFSIYNYQEKINCN